MPREPRNVDVAGDRVDGHVVEEQLLGVDADHRGDLVVEAFDLGPIRAFGGGAVAGVDGEDGGALRVADEEDAVGAEGELAGGFQIGRALLEAVGEIGAAAGRHAGEQQGGGQGRQEETDARRTHGPSPCIEAGRVCKDDSPYHAAFGGRCKQELRGPIGSVISLTHPPGRGYDFPNPTGWRFAVSSDDDDVTIFLRKAQTTNDPKLEGRVSSWSRTI